VWWSVATRSAVVAASGNNQPRSDLCKRKGLLQILFWSCQILAGSAATEEWTYLGVKKKSPASENKMFSED